AKGGVYILNLLFVSIITLYALNIQNSPERRYFYLIAFIFGLGFANHWMSILILGPILLYFFFLYRDFLRIRGFVSCFLFILAGLSAYIYLPVRAGAGPDLNIGNPETLHNFLWVVFREMYQYSAKTDAGVYVRQISVFFKLFFTNYSLFILVGMAGAWAMIKVKRKKAFFILGVFISYVVVIVPYTRTINGVFVLENILLIPAEYACLLFIAAGMGYVYSVIKKEWVNRIIFAAAAAGLLFYTGYMHYGLNNQSRDYITYDLGKSILMTMEKDSLYLADGDYNLMPVYYIIEMHKQRQDIKLANPMNLYYEWGIDYFTGKYGHVTMMPKQMADNIRSLIDSQINKADIYRSGLFKKIDEMELPYKQKQKGVLIKITAEDEIVFPGIFDMYSYRGIFDDACRRDGLKQDIITWYAKGMVKQGDDLNELDRPRDALRLYKLAAIFPVQKPEAEVYFKISSAYEKLKDADNRLLYLEKAVGKDGNYLPALENAGRIYYERGVLPRAKEMFGRAIATGRASEYAKNAFKYISVHGFSEQCEYGLRKAREHLSKGELKSAMYIYDFLIGKNYKTETIISDIGLYYFDSGNYQEALAWLLKLKNRIQTPETIYGIAYSYFKIKDTESALRETEKGMKTYENDRKLADLYMRLGGRRAAGPKP
ncbi:MAG TPA: DUF2723 domain-containing protein, partial [Candidatus Goldiibacteriota bacterium]|nr:DUF2723 domain-containing protein [Candidatus Goldiibacteriota bacterium]